MLFDADPAYSFSTSAGAGAGQSDASGLLVPRKGAIEVLTERVRLLNGVGNGVKVGSVPAGKPVVYWMSRDQRAQDNWALLYAQQQALASKSRRMKHRRKSKYVF